MVCPVRVRHEGVGFGLVCKACYTACAAQAKRAVVTCSPAWSSSAQPLGLWRPPPVHTSLTRPVPPGSHSRRVRGRWADRAGSTVAQCWGIAIPGARSRAQVRAAFRAGGSTRPPVFRGPLQPPGAFRGRLAQGSTSQARIGLGEPSPPVHPHECGGARLPQSRAPPSCAATPRVGGTSSPWGAAEPGPVHSGGCAGYAVSTARMTCIPGGPAGRIRSASPAKSSLPVSNLTDMRRGPPGALCARPGALSAHGPLFDRRAE